MNDLKDLSKLYKVNKYNLGYINIYEKYFDKIKNKSLKLWSKYFKNSKIVGIDIKYIKLNIENVETFFGDQTDVEFLKKIINKFKYFDIIIDDGSHISKHVIKSFKFLFGHLKEGGLYFIEDLHYSYYKRYGGSRFDLNKRETSMNFLKSLIDSLNYENYDRPFYKKSKFNGKINNINFYQNFAVISKGASKVYFYKNKPINSFFEKCKKLYSKLF